MADRAHGPSNGRDPDVRESNNFIREIIAAHLRDGRYDRVVTRWPPEPNGYPHIGHGQAIWLNFGLAREFGGTTYLRYDDTNPETESIEYVRAIERDVRWLGYAPDEIRFASDYFEQLYEWAVGLIERGLAYVDSQSEEEIRRGRGTVTEPGVESPYRDRPAEESLRLLDEMRRGLHPDGAHVLRARIDMAHPNMKLRDPLMYRIRRDAHHYRRGDAWKIYPLYDWAHGQEDAIEGVTHSVCTLEFDVNRPLYDWYLGAIGIEEPRPHQYEFARFNLAYTVMSKRKLLRLVQEGTVAGWDDPRMPTLSAQRRRGVRPEALRAFYERVGVTKVNSRTDLALYEHAIRDDLNAIAPRVLAVARPLKLVIENLPDGETTWIDAPYWPHDVTPPAEAPRTRHLPLTREVWISQDDFAEEPPKGWRRLSPGAAVRLRHAYVVRCTGVEHDASGAVVALRAEADLDSFDPETGEGRGTTGQKARGVIHWVGAAHGRPATFRLYDPLFAHPAPDELDDFMTALRPDSLVETQGYVEPSIADDPADTRYQFERTGYFWQDPEASRPDALVFNRIVALRDTFAKELQQEATPTQKTQPTPEPKPAPAPPAQPARDPVAELSEAQHARFLRYTGDLGVQEDDALLLAADDALAGFFEETLKAHDDAQAAANWLVNDLLRETKEKDLADLPITGAHLGGLLDRIADGTLSSRIARDVFGEMIRTGATADAIIEAKGLRQVSDAGVLEPMIAELLEQYPDKAAEYQAGKTGLMGFFVGQVMRRTHGKANPQLVTDLLRERLA